MAELTFKDLLRAGIKRNECWDGLEDWTLADWGNAMAGEAGECCNAIKKARRIELGMQNKSDRQIDNYGEALDKIRHEAIDTIAYALHVWAEASDGDHDLDSEITEIFNAVSARYGFPVKL